MVVPPAYGVGDGALILPIVVGDWLLRTAGVPGRFGFCILLLDLGIQRFNGLGFNEVGIPEFSLMI
jgi:hypothetical protein